MVIKNISRMKGTFYRELVAKGFILTELVAPIANQYKGIQWVQQLKGNGIDVSDDAVSYIANAIKRPSERGATLIIVRPGSDIDVSLDYLILSAQTAGLVYASAERFCQVRSSLRDIHMKLLHCKTIMASANEPDYFTMGEKSRAAIWISKVAFDAPAVVDVGVLFSVSH